MKVVTVTAVYENIKTKNFYGFSILFLSIYILVFSGRCFPRLKLEDVSISLPNL